ncbi:hypothetical protein V5799_000781 [Amblyomma americanum]|uniref:Uncharacterized protein n=1 Tax=Amblyomma americanum TaxID=6943 RepID=A0AAQ4D220_AMBAM
MKGRWTEPEQGQRTDFFARCKHNPDAQSFGSYTEVCRHSRYVANLKYVPEHYAMLTSLDTRVRVFTYDNEQGLSAKLCRVKSEELDVNYGIAAFDVDYDDYSNMCGSINKFGRHSRLKTLRRIVDYYRRLTSSDFAEPSCMAVVP